MSTSTDRTDADLANLTTDITAERAESKSVIDDLTTRLHTEQAHSQALEKELAACQHPDAETLIGASFQGSGQDDFFGYPANFVRVYLQDQMVTKWEDFAACRQVKPGQTVLISKKFDDAVRWAKFCASAPDNIDVLAVPAIHEPENDIKRAIAANPTNPSFTREKYLSWVTRDNDALHAMGVRTAQVLMSMSLAESEQWEVEAVDEMWWDWYQGGPAKQPKTYGDTTKQLAKFEAEAKALGKPWGFGEVGSLATVADTSGKGLVQWYADLNHALIASTAHGGLQWNDSHYAMTEPQAKAFLTGQV